jgi:hypothetical protein
MDSCAVSIYKMGRNKGGLPYFLALRSGVVLYFVRFTTISVVGGLDIAAVAQW